MINKSILNWNWNWIADSIHWANIETLFQHWKLLTTKTKNLIQLFLIWTVMLLLLYFTVFRVIKFFKLRYLSFVILFSFLFKIIEKERKLNNYIKVSHTSNAMEKLCFCHLLYELISKYCLLKSTSRRVIAWAIVQLNFDIVFVNV